MRTKLILFSALTCLLGGSMLLAPAAAQSAYPSCETTNATRCSGGGYRTCEWSDGSLDTQVCFNRTWHFA
jgi:hypothetical protein